MMRKRDGFFVTEMLEIKSNLKKVTAENFKEQEINWHSLIQFSLRASIPNEKKYISFIIEGKLVRTSQ